jgi:hypothetical protein
MDALLASGQPMVVEPKQVAMITGDYRTDPEILLGCIIVSGTLDTLQVLQAEVELHHGLDLSEEQKAVHSAFLRVWASPTEEERLAVMNWAETIADAIRPSRRRASFTWNGPSA